MKKGFLTRLIAGEMPQDGCKRWPSDHAESGGYTLIIPSCTGAFSTTSVPLEKEGTLTPEHSRQREENLAAARQRLTAFSTAGQRRARP